jgi:hypothetical protein
VSGSAPQVESRRIWVPDLGGDRASRPGQRERGRNVAFLLWILAVILVVSGIVALVRGEPLWGIVLIIVGLLVGPGGVSIFT